MRECARAKGAGRTFTRVENALEEKANDVQDALNRLTLARLVPHLRKNLVEIGLRKFQRLRKPHARTERRETCNAPAVPALLLLLPPAPPRRGTPTQSVHRRRKETLPREGTGGGWRRSDSQRIALFWAKKRSCTSARRQHTEQGGDLGL
jgi:hypothetical protein